jgi:hypothetical protein
MEVSFTATILQFGQKAEKTGWYYIPVPQSIAQQLKPNHKKSFRVKGSLDDYHFSGMALLPAGDGSFIMALNSDVRKAIRKSKGGILAIKLAVDTAALTIDATFLECLADEPAAETFFNSLPPSHQAYYSKWIVSAKTIETKTKRIALAVSTLAQQMNYGEMLRWQRDQNQ